ncbi:unnamed protein product [Soboliphyme baturini]|uniref:SUN domain-containing protein n=1 Tax=Soboliphyme baturini TaxID=241478 RepID=A0A183J6U1_9BILA|nr:unnamed protein product [Soboliphyme baturini]
MLIISGCNKREIYEYIDKLLAKYDADKTGMADHALESSGGSIVSTRCTETFNPRTRLESIFGMPLWYSSYSPRTVIQPHISPGECWAFKGSVGSLVIQLSGVVNITGFSYEHIPKSLSPDGNIDSAPRQFSVYVSIYIFALVVMVVIQIMAVLFSVKFLILRYFFIPNLGPLFDRRDLF